MSESSVLLKWGTIKGWDNISDKSLEILKEYFKDGQPFGCAEDRPNEERRKILCSFIDSHEGEIQNDWTGKKMTKAEAKEYIMDYGKEKKTG